MRPFGTVVEVRIPRILHRIPRGAYQAIGILLGYNAYELLRALCGQADGTARANAEQIVDLERFLHVDGERAAQQAVIHHTTFLQFLNIFYGTVHFVIPLAVLALWWRRSKVGYRKWRNRIVATTLLALVGFWLWPVAPPRLLPPEFGFVDTNAAFGGLGVLDSGPGKDLNLNAAMPSLHVGWALWCAAAGAALARRRATKALLWAYPAFTFLTVTLTGNHYWLDAVGGLAADLAGYAIGDRATLALDRWRSTRRGVSTVRLAPSETDDGDAHRHHHDSLGAAAHQTELEALPEHA